MTQMQTISFSVTPLVAANLAKRAAPLNIRASEYARRLFDAAYHARVLQERGEAAEDTALDAQVRQVFLLADCEPEFIADALAMPQALVQKILAGWRQAARERQAPPAPATPPPPLPARCTRPGRLSGRGDPQTLGRWQEREGDSRRDRQDRRRDERVGLQKPRRVSIAAPARGGVT